MPPKKSFRKSRGKLNIQSNQAVRLIKNAKKCTTSSRPDKSNIQHKDYRKITVDRNEQIIPDRYKSDIDWCKSCNSNYDYECDRMSTELRTIIYGKIPHSQDGRKMGFSTKGIEDVSAYCLTEQDKELKQNILNYLNNCLNAREYYQENCIYDVNNKNTNLEDSHQYYISKLIEAVQNCST